MPQRDPKTGLPLIGVEDKRPITVRVKSDGKTTEVVDAESGRPIQGIQSVSWGGFQMGQRPPPLVLVIAPNFYSIELDDYSPAMSARVPAHVAAMEDAPALKDGQQLILMEGGKPTGVLEVAKGEKDGAPIVQLNIVPEGDDTAPVP